MLRIMRSRRVVSSELLFDQLVYKVFVELGSTRIYTRIEKLLKFLYFDRKKRNLNRSFSTFLWLTRSLEKYKCTAVGEEIATT